MVLGDKEITKTAAWKAWSLRHLAVGIPTGIAVYLFRMSRAQWHPMHAWNRAFGDVAFLLLAITLVMGPLSRLWTPAKRVLPWRRELGIWSALTAIIHVVIILDGWVEWELFRFFYSFNPFFNEWVLDRGFAIGNLIGIIALGYVLMLMATSNEWSVRALGSAAWKYIQQRAYVYYVLVVLHVAYFLFLHRPDNPNWFSLPFLILVAGVLLFQMIGFTLTVRSRKRRDAG